MGKKKLHKNILLLIGAVFVTLLVLEIVVEIVAPQKLVRNQPDEHLVYRLIPNINYYDSAYLTEDDLLRYKVSTNSQGFRDREHDIEKNAGVTRVMVLGDSFVEGAASILKERFTSRLEEELNKKGKYEVISVGVGSYSTENQLQYYEKEGRQYHPDIVVVAFFLNDIWDNTRRGLYHVEDGELVDNTPIHISKLKKAFMYCGSRSHICAWAWNIVAFNPVIVKLFSSVAPEEDAGTLEFLMWGIPKDLFLEGMDERVVQSFEKTELLMQRFKESVDGDFIVFLIPLREQVDDALSENFKKEHFQGEIVVRDKPQQRMTEILRRNKIAYIDPLPMFQEMNTNNTFFHDVDGHTNKEGNLLMAQGLARLLVEAPPGRRIVIE